MKASAYAALAATMLFWGAAGSFIRSQGLALEPENGLALRYAIIAVIAAAGLAMTGGWRVARADWPRLLFAGLIGMTGYNMFIAHGMALTPAGVAGVIIAVEPLLITLGAWLVLREPFTPHLAAGIALASLGAVVLFWDGLPTQSNAVSWLGVAFVLLSCASWAVYTIASKPLLQRYGSFQITAWTMLIAAPVIVASGSQSVFATAALLDRRQWLELAWLVIPNGILGTVMWNYGAGRLPGATAGAFLYLIPVIAVCTGAIVLGESITPNVVIGCALTLSGVALAQFGPLLAFRRA